MTAVLPSHQIQHLPTEQAYLEGRGGEGREGGEGRGRRRSREVQSTKEEGGLLANLRCLFPLVESDREREEGTQHGVEVETVTCTITEQPV